MATAATLATIPQILKEIWAPDIFEFMYENEPFFGLVEKDESWVGQITHVVVDYGGMGGRSNTFASAQSAKSPSKLARMDVETRDNFGLCSVDHKLITLSRNDKGALVRILTKESEKILGKVKRSTCWQFWRNGGGCIGKISAIAGSTFTFVDLNDCRNVAVGDSLSLSADDGTGGAGVRAGDALQVTGINEDTGVITCHAGIVATVGAAVVNDYVFPVGDYNMAFTGVPAYVTLSAPGVGGVPANIWNMVRTAHPTFLAGSRFTGTVATVVASIQNALAKAHRRNIKTTHLFCAPEIYAALESALQSAKRYTDEKASHGLVGFKALEFTTQGGQIVKAYSTSDMPKSADGATSYVFGMNLDTWKFHTADSFPMDLGSVAGASKYMLEASANQSEYRIGGYGNLYTDAPGQNWVLALT